MRKWLSIWLVSLITVAGLASAWTRAQTVVPKLGPPAVSPNPMIVSGGDIGFRVDGTRDGKAVGILVVRIGGQWVETTAGLTSKQLVER